MEQMDLLICNFWEHGVWSSEGACNMYFGLKARELCLPIVVCVLRDEVQIK